MKVEDIGGTCWEAPAGWSSFLIEEEYGGESRKVEDIAGGCWAEDWTSSFRIDEEKGGESTKVEAGGRGAAEEEATSSLRIDEESGGESTKVDDGGGGGNCCEETADERVLRRRERELMICLVSTSSCEYFSSTSTSLTETISPRGKKSEGDGSLPLSEDLGFLCLNFQRALELGNQGISRQFSDSLLEALDVLEGFLLRLRQLFLQRGNHILIVRSI